MINIYYEVETLFFNDGWENVWKDEHDQPITFSTYEEAKKELDEFMEDINDDYECGYLSDNYSADDYRIVRKTDEVIHVLGAA